MPVTLTESPAETSPPGTKEARILVVDDERSTARLHRGLLSPFFDVSIASSGEEALEVCEWELPDLILLDIGMPGMDGLETCRRLREKTAIPILFATARETAEEHLQAFDAGGSDIFVKPVAAELLIYKVRRAIARYRAKQDEMQERAHLDAITRDVMQSMDEASTLISFMQASLGSRSLEHLAQNFVNAAKAMGVHCSVLIRQGEDEAYESTSGMLNSLERVALARGKDRGTTFRLRQHLGINTPSVTIIVSNAPEAGSDAEQQIKDCMARLASAAEALAENVSMRRKSSERAEQMQLALADTVSTVDNLQRDQRMMITDVRMLLQSLSDQMDQTFSWLATDRAQEKEISQRFNSTVEQILRTLLRGAQLDGEFSKIIEQLKGGKEDDLELF